MCVTSQMGPSHMSHWSHIRITISLSHPSHIGIMHRIGLSHWSHIGIAHTIWIVQKDHAKTDKGSRTNHCNLDHPLPLPLRCPSPLLPLRCHCANHRCHRSAIHCWQHRCIAVAPSITVVACLILLSVVVDSSPLLPHFLLVIIANLFRLIVASIDPASIGGDGSVFVCVPPIGGIGTVVVIVALIVVPLYSSPEAPLLHVSIANLQVLPYLDAHQSSPT